MTIVLLSVAYLAFVLVLCSLFKINKAEDEPCE